MRRGTDPADRVPDGGRLTRPERTRATGWRGEEAPAVPECRESDPITQAEGRVLARVAGVGALLVGVVLVALVLFGGDGGHKYKLLFETGGQLVAGNQVLVGGQPIGTVDEITLTEDAQAEVDITVDEALHEGTTAIVRATSLSGIANRYVSISPGPTTPSPRSPRAARSAPTARPRRSTSTSSSTRSTSPPGRRCRTSSRARRRSTPATRRRRARPTSTSPPACRRPTRLLAELTRDQTSLSRFLVEGDEALGAVAERRDDLSALTENGNRALGAIASRERGPRPHPRRPAAGAAPGEHDLRQPARGARRPRPADRRPRRRRRPTCRRSCASCRHGRTGRSRSSATCASRSASPGPSNDLNDSLKALPGAPARRQQGRAGRRSRRSTRASTMIDFARPVHARPARLPQQVRPGHGLLRRQRPLRPRAPGLGEPASPTTRATSAARPDPARRAVRRLPALGWSFTRCPGGATQANPGWPSPHRPPVPGRRLARRRSATPTTCPRDHEADPRHLRRARRRGGDPRHRHGDRRRRRHLRGPRDLRQRRLPGRGRGGPGRRRQGRRRSPTSTSPARTSRSRRGRQPATRARPWS